MSRIGKQPVVLPAGVKAQVADGKVKIETVDSPQKCKRLGGQEMRRHYCELRKPGGKVEIKPIPTPQDCSRRGGKVVNKPKHPRGARSQRPLD